MAFSLLLLPLTLPVGQAADAPFADVEFTPIITDDADHADFVDIREIAIGEPGDASIVVRIKPNAWTVTDPTVAIHVFYTAKGKDFRSGMDGSGKPVSSNPWKSCTKGDGVAYCVMPYETLGVDVGDKITSTSSISYIGVAQDYAPGGLYVPDGVLGPKGKDYEIKGSTSKSGAAATPELLALTAAESSMTSEPDSSVAYKFAVANKGSGNASYELLAEGLPPGFDASFDPAKGSLEAGKSLDGTLNVVVPADAEAGSHDFTVVAKGAQGGNATLNLTLEVTEPASGSASATTSRAPRTNESGSSSEAATNSTSNGTAGAKQVDEAAIPAPPMLAILGALAAGALLVARRRMR